MVRPPHRLRQRLTSVSRHAFRTTYSRLASGRRARLDKQTELEEALRRVELDERRFGLTERRFELVYRSVLLVMAVALTSITIYCSMNGVHWSIPVATGGGSLVTVLASVIDKRKGPKSDNDPGKGAGLA